MHHDKKDNSSAPSKGSAPSVSSARAHFANYFDEILSGASVGLWDWDLRSGHIIYSREWERIAGYDEGELEPTLDSWENAVLDEDIGSANEAIDRYLRGETQSYIAEFRMRRKDGSIIWAQDKGIVTEWDDEGKPVRFVGVLQDITHLRQTEDALSQRNAHLSFIANMVGLATWEYDIKNSRILYSPEYIQMLGLSHDTVQATLQEWGSWIHPDDYFDAHEAFENYLSGKSDQYSHKFRIRKQNGEYIWFLDSGRIVEWDYRGEPLHILGGSLDITAMKLTEEKLEELLHENEQYNVRLQLEIQNTVKKLDEARQMNHAVFDANPYVNILFDKDLNAIDCNPATVAYLGFETKEQLLAGILPLIHKNMPDYQPDGKPSVPLTERIAQTIKEGYLEFETELNLNGQSTPMRFVMKKIPYKEDFVVAVYQLDLKQLKEAKSELQRQDKLLRDVNGVATTLLEANVDDFDPTMWSCLKLLGETMRVDIVSLWKNCEHEGQSASQQLFCWSRDDISYKKTPEDRLLIYSNVPEWHDTLISNSSVSTPPQTTLAAKYKFSPYPVISTLMIPIRHSNEFWGFLSLDDCSKERPFSSAEESILTSATTLFVSSILRNEGLINLIAAKEAAQKSARAKTQFLANMSHEIRTPMNAIIGMTAIARKSDEMEKIQYSLNRIDGASQQLLGIINDILDMSKIEANKLEIVAREFNFNKMMRNIFNVINVKIEEKNQKFSFDFEDMFGRNVIADELRLTQVIVNLLTNAVKFTPEEGEINLRMRQTPTDDDSAILHVEVQDTGIGVDDDQKERLFQSFEQADGSITRRFGGTGLGLAICKTIVTLMGGDIWVESTKGNGSTFIFEVDIKLGHETLEPATRSPRSNLRILVADDHEDVLLYFQSILQGFKMDADCASDGQEAIDMAVSALQSGRPYDLIFLDWNMPNVSGAQAAEEINRMMDGSTTIVMISVADWSELKGDALKAGVQHFLAKPIQPSLLFNTIVELTEYPGMDDNYNSGQEVSNWENKTILLAEDIEINREILMSILEDTGVKIECAKNGVQAVDMYQRNNDRYDLILMDVQMPDLDGMGATKGIRNSGLYNAKTIPIIAMTANAFKEDVEACLAAGMDNHIAKPIDVEDLMDKLSLYLG
ncbi:response regulator [Eubacteriales bacterium OttesenSCG-928-K08]|nr:response regulator [Eubacteriales bacterium OttesenSCG-928-K08]